MKSIIFWRWIVLGLVLALATLVTAACGAVSAPATEPPDSVARPTLLFLFSQP